MNTKPPPTKRDQELTYLESSSASSMPKWSRRDFAILSGISFLGMPVDSTAGESTVSQTPGLGLPDRLQQIVVPAPTFSIEPVIGDGKWIAREPPKDPIGNYDTREYDVSVGIRAVGTGTSERFAAATVAPVQLPEQRIQSVKIEKEGCNAELQPLAKEAARLFVLTSLVKGQVIQAVARYRIQISKTFHGYSAENLAVKQRYNRRYFGQWMGSSPGIQSGARAVKVLSKKLTEGIEHPFDWAKRFQEWVFENIRGREMNYTSVEKAIENKVGDCEERAGVFVALCRSKGIPARLVWVPNHAWAEFCLFDNSGKPHWIPAHTAAYNWFGWTGANELVLQKGDRIVLPDSRKKVRLVADWLSWKGSKPKVEFQATIKPVEVDGKTSPDSRVKDSKGRWNLTGDHPDKKYMRK